MVFFCYSSLNAQSINDILNYVIIWDHLLNEQKNKVERCGIPGFKVRISRSQTGDEEGVAGNIEEKPVERGIPEASGDRVLRRISENLFQILLRIWVR